LLNNNIENKDVKRIKGQNMINFSKLSLKSSNFRKDNSFSCKNPKKDNSATITKNRCA